MNKTVLSLAVLTASGGYVAFANHAFDGSSPPLPAVEQVETAEVIAPAEATPVTTAPLLAPRPATPVIEDDEADDSPVPAAILVMPAQAALPAETTPAAPVVANEARATESPTSKVAPTPAPLAARPTAKTAAVRTGKFSDGTYTGSAENAYYGTVQVQAVILNGRLTAVEVLDYPRDRKTSRRINSYALPALEQEAISAQSASVDIVTGATLTSRAYRASLGRALQQAAAAHA